MLRPRGEGDVGDRPTSRDERDGKRRGPFLFASSRFAGFDGSSWVWTWMWTWTAHRYKWYLRKKKVLTRAGMTHLYSNFVTTLTIYSIEEGFRYSPPMRYPIHRNPSRRYLHN
jgi:hypothetical protein